MSRTKRAQTLVASLIVIVIIATLAVVLLNGTQAGKSARPDGKGTTVMGAAKYEAKDEVCRSNLAQCRQGIQIARLNADDAPPATLDEIRIGAQFYSCPVGKVPYDYDSATGEVRCPHPGHEKY